MPPSHSQAPSCVQPTPGRRGVSAETGWAGPTAAGASAPSAPAGAVTAAGAWTAPDRVTVLAGGRSTVTAGFGRVSGTGSTSRTASTSHST